MSERIAEGAPNTSAGGNRSGTRPRPTLDEVRSQLGDCRRCQLSETRTRIVFGTGDPHAKVMFIGEAPGRNEDLKGEPFVGAAGKMLDELLLEAGLRRDQVYIANILKCRPPNNRDPKPEEMTLCTPFLRDQVRAIMPQVLVTLGNFATQFVLRTQRGITGLRGKVHKAGRFTVLPIFHPAAAIYDRKKLPLLHADFALLGSMLADGQADSGAASGQGGGAGQGGASGQGGAASRSGGEAS